MLDPFGKNASKTLWFAALMINWVWAMEESSEQKCQIELQEQ